jgi:indolepyruvate ferredoxin oxidoreductase alpha subunit
MEDVTTIDPYNLTQTAEALKNALSRTTPSLIVSRAPCPLREKKNVGPVKRIITDKCKSCFACVRLGCPAIEAREKGKPPVIDGSLCAGCSLCRQVCTFNAITDGDEQ